MHVAEPRAPYGCAVEKEAAHCAEVILLAFPCERGRTARVTNATKVESAHCETGVGESGINVADNLDGIAPWSAGSPRRVEEGLGDGPTGSPICPPRRLHGWHTTAAHL